MTSHRADHSAGDDDAVVPGTAALPIEANDAAPGAWTDGTTGFSIVLEVLLRAAGTTVVTAVLFSTFLDAEAGGDRPLDVGAWLTTVSLSGIFCAAWAARDTATWQTRSLLIRWVPALLLMAAVMAVAAMSTGTERARTDDVDVASASSTCAVLAVGLLLFVWLGVLAGRAAQRSLGSPPQD